MKRAFSWILLLTALHLPAMATAWNSSDHRQIGREALTDVAASWGLDQPVPVRPLQALLQKLAPIREELGDAWHFSHYLGLNTKIDLAHPEPEVEGKTTLTPLDILSVYSTDPDDGRDQDLFVRDAQGNPQYAYPDQKWFGSLRGPNSQAFRHIEKPAFNPRHPIATFGLPLRSVGEATRRVKVYYQLSRLAFALEEPYWGWRFLANALHYMEDLHQPYHTAQITPRLVVHGLAAYLSWGRDTLGLMGTFAHLVSNSHRFFESYVELPVPEAMPLKEDAIQSLRGTAVLDMGGDVQEFARHSRDASNHLFSRLIESVERILSPELMGPTVFKSDGPDADDPHLFAIKTPEAQAAQTILFEIVSDRFASSGRSIRTLVKQILSEPKTPPRDLLLDLDAWLDHHHDQPEN